MNATAQKWSLRVLQGSPERYAVSSCASSVTVTYAGASLTFITQTGEPGVGAAVTSDVNQFLSSCRSAPRCVGSRM